MLMNIENPSGSAFERENNLCMWFFCCELFQVEFMLITWTVRTMFSYRLCKVAREVVEGPRGPIVIIVEVIQCKVD